MKFIAALAAGVAAPLSGGSLRTLVRLLVLLLGSIVVFSVGFQVIMALEGRDFSWIASVYWTVVTMSTLGFGDIVFGSDIGRAYSIVVLFAGAVLILVLLPFTFIQLVYIPWRAAVREARAPRSVDPDLRGHLLLTGREPLAEALIHRATAAGLPYVLIVEDIEEAVALHDRGYTVMVGALHDPDTYRAAGVDRAAMLVTARTDPTNANVAFTVREVTSQGVVVATADSPDAVDVLQLAGADHVIERGPLLGDAFARRILSPDASASIVATVADVAIAEASAAGTHLVGRSVADLDLTARFGVAIIGIWDRGSLQIATPERTIEETSILLLAGPPQALRAYDHAHAGDRRGLPADGDHPVLIIGGGRVGRATARALADRGVTSRIVERQPDRVARFPDAIIGDAADLEVLQQAGIEQTPAVVITTHDDDTNIYLTLYCRRLRTDVEILTRVDIDRNGSTAHRAGADVVLSYASMAATEAWNRLRDDPTLLLAEGLVIFAVPVPPRFAGRTLAATEVRQDTGCAIIGLVVDGHGHMDLTDETVLPADGRLLLIGDARAEDRFIARHIAPHDRPGLFTRVRDRLAGTGAPGRR